MIEKNADICMLEWCNHNLWHRQLSIFICHLSGSLRSMIAAPNLDTLSRHCCKSRLMCTTSLRDKLLFSVMFVTYEIGGLPLFLFASTFPWSTVVIRFVFVFLFAWLTQVSKFSPDFNVTGLQRIHFLHLILLCQRCTATFAKRFYLML